MKNDNVIHTVYKITNLINKKIYIGKHSTTNLDDGYMGSGTEIVKAIKKHGKVNFEKQIIAKFDCEQEAFALEMQFVDYGFVKLKSTYNKTLGGDGRNTIEYLTSIGDYIQIKKYKSDLRLLNGKKVNTNKHKPQKKYSGKPQVETDITKHGMYTKKDVTKIGKVTLTKKNQINSTSKP